MHIFNPTQTLVQQSENLSTISSYNTNYDGENSGLSWGADYFTFLTDSGIDAIPFTEAGEATDSTTESQNFDELLDLSTRGACLDSPFVLAQLNIFFKEIGPYTCPFIHQETLMAEYTAGKLPTVLIVAILAISSDDLSRGKAYSQIAYDMVDSNVKGLKDLFRTLQSQVVLMIFRGLLCI